MSIATNILATARSLGQIRTAAKSRGVGAAVADGCAEYRFADQSVIRIQGRKVRVGAWRYIEVDAAPPTTRQCSAPDCWACAGTGIDRDGKICIWNDGIPF